MAEGRGQGQGHPAARCDAERAPSGQSGMGADGDLVCATGAHSIRSLARSPTHSLTRTRHVLIDAVSARSAGTQPGPGKSLECPHPFVRWTVRLSESRLEATSPPSEIPIPALARRPLVAEPALIRNNSRAPCLSMLLMDCLFPMDCLLPMKCLLRISGAWDGGRTLQGRDACPRAGSLRRRRWCHRLPLSWASGVWQEGKTLQCRAAR